MITNFLKQITNFLKQIKNFFEQNTSFFEQNTSFFEQNTSFFEQIKNFFEQIKNFFKQMKIFFKKIASFIKKTVSLIINFIKKTASLIKKFIISLFTEYWIITWSITIISFTAHYIDFYNRLRPLQIKYLIFGYIIIYILFVIMYVIIGFFFYKHWERDYVFLKILFIIFWLLMLSHLGYDGDWTSQYDDGVMLLGRFYETNLRFFVEYILDTQNHFWIWLNIKRVIWGFSQLESAPIYFLELNVPIRFAENPNYEHMTFLGQKVIKYIEHFDGHNLWELLPGETFEEVMKHDDAVREMWRREEYIRTGKRLPHYSRLFRE